MRETAIASHCHAGSKNYGELDGRLRRCVDVVVVVVVVVVVAILWSEFFLHLEISAFRVVVLVVVAVLWSEFLDLKVSSFPQITLKR